jgi:hypothetical protein
VCVCVCDGKRRGVDDTKSGLWDPTEWDAQNMR